jgi:hypothetical protein
MATPDAGGADAMRSAAAAQPAASARGVHTGA